MVEGRRGLGRGLSALLEETQAASSPEGRRAAGVLDIPIELIQRNPGQPRRNFSDTDLDELAASVRERGVLQPILLPASAGGERRNAPSCVQFPHWFGSSTTSRRWRSH